jgi:hypothetical protein
MKALHAALVAVMIGLTFAASTFAAETKKADVPATAEKKDAGGKAKKEEGRKKAKERTESTGPVSGKEPFDVKTGGCPEGPPCKK